MSLFLGFGLPLFSFFLSLSLFSWKKPLSYLTSWVLGLLSFLFAWGVNYLVRAIYQGFIDYKFFYANTIGDLFFSITLLTYLPLLMVSYLGFHWIFARGNKEGFFASLYFWFAGFFSSFSLYILLQTSSAYSFFEYLLIPLLLISFLLVVFYTLSVLRSLPTWISLLILLIIGIFFSLPPILWEALYFKSFLIIFSLAIICGIFSAYFILRHRKT